MSFSFVFFFCEKKETSLLLDCSLNEQMFNFHRRSVDRNKHKCTVFWSVFVKWGLTLPYILMETHLLTFVTLEIKNKWISLRLPMGMSTIWSDNKTATRAVYENYSVCVRMLIFPLLTNHLDFHSWKQGGNWHWQSSSVHRESSIGCHICPLLFPPDVCVWERL